jgi:RHS repeat-associated protein
MLGGALDEVTCTTYDSQGALREVRFGTAAPAVVDPCAPGALDAPLVSGVAARTVYDIDPLGRRVGREVIDGAGTTLDRRFWVYAPTAIGPIAELDAAGRIRQRYVYATRGHVPDVIETWDYDAAIGEPTQSTWRVISDARGSVIAVVDVATGATIQSRRYGPWGELLADTAPAVQPFGFTGGLHDEYTGWVRLGARDYDPLLGQWLAPDPLGWDAGDTNFYAYVFADPVNLIDPTGLSASGLPAWHPGEWGIFNSARGMATLEATSNFAAGWGDTVSFGLGALARRIYGVDDVVDRCSSG